MNTGMVLSSVALVVSLAITGFRLFDWLAHADRGFLVSTAKRLLWLATLASVPCFVLLILNQQWTMALVVAAVLVIAPSAGNWRSILRGPPISASWDPPASAPWHPPVAASWHQGDPPHATMGSANQALPDPDLVRRAAVILEDYLGSTVRVEAIGHSSGSVLERSGQNPAYGRPMSVEEALDVLGLNARATSAEIGFAHRRLMMLVHPDRGGTDYLAAKINRAKHILLADRSDSQRPA